LLFEYDLVSNRTSQKVDKGNDGTIDEVTKYTYDENDRLLTELHDAQNDGVFEKTTTYGYDHTQQTSKTVHVDGTKINETTYQYNLQGRMAVVTITTFNEDGTVARNERTTYGYDESGIRISALHEVDSDGDGTLDTATLTEYLNDPLNITGYSQVLKQTETDLKTGEVTITTYVIGLQRISQIVEKSGTKTEYYFTFDGHGSTRVLTDFIGTIVELYSYDAFGNALGFDPTNAKTEFLYSGEQFDSKINQQYLRQRYYDPTTGRFNRLDPFFGNLNDPLSLHKYTYANGDPINVIDPSGLFGIGNVMGAISFMTNLALSFGRIAIPIFRRGIFNVTKLSVFISATSEIRNHLFKWSTLGNGGYNAETLLLKLRNDVIAKWNGLSQNERIELIRKIYTCGIISWDIHEMTFDQKKDWTDGMFGEVIEETLSYRGKVYSVAEVNYLLWGLINRLAWESGSNPFLSNYVTTYTAAYSYRVFGGGIMIMNQWYQYFLNSKEQVPKYETITGRLAWAYYGWQWAVNEYVPAPEQEALDLATATNIQFPSGLSWSAGGHVDYRTFKGFVR
jgi:RHS repeat-associated protein